MMFEIKKSDLERVNHLSSFIWKNLLQKAKSGQFWSFLDLRI